MADVGRFGVFLPSYIWEGDGPERARGIKAFARTVEELGFDSLFITDHLLAAKRFYSVNWLEPLMTLAVAAGATERVRLGTSILIMPLRNPVILAKELATLQFLSDNRVILGAGVGWNDAEYEAVGVHKSERGKRTDEMLDIMMPLLEGETVTYHGQLLLGRRRVHRAADRAAARCSGSAAARSWPTPSRRTCRSSSSRSRRGPSAPTAGSRGRPARRRTSPATGHELQAAMREAGKDPSDTLVAHENFLHLVLTDDPAEGARGAARGVPQGHERRARAGLPRVGLPVRDAGRDRRLAPGAGRRRRRVLLPAHDDARTRRSSSCGSTTSSRTSRSRPTAGPVRRPPTPGPVAVASMTRRVALLGKPLKRRHSQVMHDAAFDAAGIDARYVLLELEPDEVEPAVAAARGAGVARARRDRAVQAGRRRARRRGRAGRRRRSARSTTSSATDDGPAGRLQHRRARVPGRRRARDGPPAGGRDVVVAGRRRRGARGRVSPASTPGRAG